MSLCWEPGVCLVSNEKDQPNLFPSVPGSIFGGYAQDYVLLSPYPELLRAASPRLCSVDSSFQAPSHLTQATQVVLIKSQTAKKSASQQNNWKYKMQTVKYAFKGIC